MHTYEILVEDITPCGGEQHARRQILEATAESPEAYVEENKRFPIVKSFKNASGDVVITAENGKGYMTRYTFTE